jgi:hypothetical protein
MAHVFLPRFPQPPTLATESFVAVMTCSLLSRDVTRRDMTHTLGLYRYLLRHKLLETGFLGDRLELGSECWPMSLVGCIKAVSFACNPTSHLPSPSNHNPLYTRNLNPVMHTSRVSSPRHSTSRVFFCLETASLHSSRTRLHSPTPLTHFALCHRSLRHSTPLAATREWATLLDDPRLASYLTRPLVCITASTAAIFNPRLL